MRCLTCFILVLGSLCLTMMGCGDDGQKSSIPTGAKKSEPPLGIDGETYRSPKIFKISNLPVDSWTILVRHNPADKTKLEVWDNTVADRQENPAVLRHLIQSNPPPGETHLLLQPTEDKFQTSHRGAFDNQMPFIYISIEGQNSRQERSASQFVELYLTQKDYHFAETSTGTVITTDSVMGHWLKVTQREDYGKISYTFFDRRKSNRIEIYRFLYWAPADRYDEFLPVYEQIAASFALNIL